MNVIGIVAEYNPFHRGHAWHIARSRELLGEDAAVVCVLSGDFVQRGEPAIFDKFTRAEASISSSSCRCPGACRQRRASPAERCRCWTRLGAHI